MSNPVVHFEVVGQDVAALSRFYGDLFGWKTSPIPGLDYTTVEKEENGIGGGIGLARDGGSGHVTFYVSVEDPQAALDRAVELGGRVVAPVESIPNVVTLALLADPEGHVIGLVGRDTPTA